MLNETTDIQNSSSGFLSESVSNPSARFSVAPMLDWTDMLI
ncbi:hypothetical protein [Grimontia marina]|uniref:Uncharacterized protein n=1 Tax=Grimontia marina TaxID=646534 RepID=A0A128FE05_9GAMM|nr:hypothetical protein [Grimontia marina]CZF85033.1 hypothetical protein GMA8713_03349 [Grimontia marina]